MRLYMHLRIGWAISLNSIIWNSYLTKQSISQFFLQNKHVYDLKVDICTIFPILPNIRTVSVEYLIVMVEFLAQDIRTVPIN